MSRHATLARSVLFLLAAPAAQAACPADAAGRVAILSNDFAALHAVVERAESCATDALAVTANQTTEFDALATPALTADPAQYTVVITATSSFAASLAEGLIRPLDDLVAEYGQDLQPNQIIRIDGKVMAVAFMANAEHLFFREDVLAEAGVEPPQTWDDVLAAAEAIEAQGAMEHPLALAYAPGWELGMAFVNLYLGLGGQLFEPGTARPAIANETGVRALETMRALASHMDPDHLTFTAESIAPLFEAGEVAMAMTWGSEAPKLLPGTAVAPTAAPHMRLAAAPLAVPEGAPATTVWWDGFTIAKNVSDEDAEASFRVMMHAIAPDLAQENPDLAVWLVKGWQPTPAAEGVLASIRGGAPSYPSLPYASLLHTAIDASIAEVLQGTKAPEQALAEAEAAYEAMAREAGYLD